MEYTTEEVDLVLQPLGFEDIRSNPNAPRDCDEDIRGGRGESDSLPVSSIFSVAMGMKRKKNLSSEPHRSPSKKAGDGPAAGPTPTELAMLKWKRKWKCAAREVLHMKDPWAPLHLEKLEAERVRRYRYNALTKTWLEDETQVKMATEPFGRGAMRECFRLKKLSSFAHLQHWKHASNYVAKRYLEPAERSTYFEDVRLQMDAKLWAEEFNRHNPPKKVDIFQVSVIEFLERPGSPLFHLEHFIEGSYIKYNSNSGFISSQETRLTPQAFSHFTFERSGHELVVVDVQGVGDLYTDPQIHTAHGSDYGEGNLGVRGMALFFHSHVCNCICRAMGLTPFDLAPEEEATQGASTPGSEPGTRLRGAEELCVGMSPKELHFLVRPLSFPGDPESQDSGFRSLSSSSEGPQEEEEDCPGDLELGSDSEEAPGTPEHPTPLPVRLLRRRTRYDSESSTLGDEVDRAEFQRQAVQRARPSSVLGEVERRHLARDLLTRNPVSRAQRSVLGQIHLEMARCHESGRFLLDSSEPYDQRAAVFHLELAARCGALEAILTLARAHQGLPHDLLADWTLPETEENLATGVDYLEQAARAGDRASMIAFAKALDTGIGLGCRREVNWEEAALWYDLAVTTTEEDEGGEYDGCMDDPPYLLLARQAELRLKGGHGLAKDPHTAGELYQRAATAATAAMKGRLANRYYQLAEEAMQEEL